MKCISFKPIADKIKNSDNFLIFMIGDSITWGAHASSAEKTYTAVFAQKLAERLENKKVVRYDGKAVDGREGELMPLESYEGPFTVSEGNNGCVTVVRCGIGGNTVQRILNRKSDFIGKEIEGRTADLFFINAGINDALKSDAKKYISEEGYRTNLEILIDEIKKGNPCADIVLMTPTYNDLGIEPVSHLDPYVAQMIDVAEKYGIPVIDLHHTWMEHLNVGGENYGQGDWLCGVEGDSCHPSDKGHEEIAKNIISVLFSDN